MIRVGFQPIGGSGWQGGRNYLWNLLHALSLLDEQKLQPVLLLDGAEGQELLLPNVERFGRSGPLTSVWARRAGTTAYWLLDRNLVDEYWLRRARVDLFSHGTPLGKSSRVPWLYWIPDVQHRRHPEFFTSLGRRERDHIFREALDHAAGVMTSSAAAREDLLRFFGPSAERVKVLHFVSSPRVDVTQLPSLEELGRRFQVPPRYFHLPNQFWKHKNHRVVIDALAEAARTEPALRVVATGAKDDPRNPHYHDELMDHVHRIGAADRFRYLGMVSYDEMMALMRHSVAAINPSLFEGWSSTVEEAKSIGKRMLLSDIDVHREQNPPRGRFFAPHDPAALAALMLETWRSFDLVEEERAIAQAAQALPERVRAFGRGYQEIVVGALET